MAAQDGYGSRDTIVSIGLVTGSRFADVLRGNDNANTIRGDAGDDSLFGGNGFDLLEGGPGADLLDGGEGSDTVTYAGAPTGVSVDLIVGDAGDGYGTVDRIVSVGNIIGSPFEDVLIGDGNDNWIRAGAGDDFLAGNQGNNILDGGAGNDTVGYQGDWYLVPGLKVDLATGVATNQFGERDTLIGIENVVGTLHDDELAGDRKANRLSGGSGDDTLLGRAGDDVLSGGVGNNVLDGGEGSDTVVLPVATELDLQAGYAIRDDYNERDTLISIGLAEGSNQGDVLRGNDNFNRLDGRQGDDVLAGRHGNDLLIGGEGADRVEFYSPADGTDRIQEFESGSDAVFVHRELFGLTGQPSGVLSPHLLSVGNAPDADDLFLFNPANRLLSFEPDGSGPQLSAPLAFLDGVSDLSANDIWLI